MKGSPTVEPDETLEAMRFLWAMVGVSAGLADVVRRETEPGGERLTCRTRSTGKVTTVSRRIPWTEAEERRYVDELDRALNGSGHTAYQAPSVEHARAAGGERYGRELVGAR